MTSENETPSSSFEEKRRYPRHPVKLQMHLWQTLNEAIEGFVTDMTEVGLGFRSSHKFQISEDLGITVYLSKGESGDDRIEGTGKIIWRTPHQEEDWKGYRYGMYLQKMSPYSRKRLMIYIQTLEGEERSSH